MQPTVRVLALGGSLRRDSWNHKLVEIAARGAREAGAEVTVVQLRDFPMPVFDQDLEQEQGLPPGGRALRELMKSHDAFLLACPEYNSSISAALKNAIDWASRQQPGEKSLECFAGKVAGLVAASPGALGGLRGLVTVRSILGNLSMIVIPEQIAVGKVHEVMGVDGGIADEKTRVSVERVGARLAHVARALKPA